MSIAWCVVFQDDQLPEVASTSRETSKHWWGVVPNCGKVNGEFLFHLANPYLDVAFYGVALPC